MRVSRTRFSKRRSKRKTEFPIVAVVQKKRKAKYIANKASDMGVHESQPFSMLAKSNKRFAKNDRWQSESFTSSLSLSSRDDEANRSQEVKLAEAKFNASGLKKSNPSKAKKKSRASIDYKNVILLRSLITAEGKILPRRINKLTAKQQRFVQKAIKSARLMGLLPFINKSRPLS